MKRVVVSLFVIVVVAASSGWTGSESELVNPLEVSLSNRAPLTDFVWPDVVLYDNGPLVNSPGTGVGGADESILQTNLALNTLGFGHQFALGYSIADDFTVTDPAGWQIDDITFFAYQTNSPTTSTITGVYVAIWDGPPDAGGTVVWGDQTTNRLLTTGWSNIYRVTDTTSGSATNRPVMENVATIGTTLAPGTYWLQWTTDGTLSSGPWAPPITITGQTTTGNALQYTTAWAAALDSGTSTQQGFPFIINGSVLGRAPAFPPFDGVLWDNGDSDGSNAYSNATSVPFGYRRSLLDDFVVPAGQNWPLRHFSWRHIWDSLLMPSGAGVELAIRANDPNGGGAGIDGPGAVIATPVVRFYYESPTGRSWFGRPEMWSTAEFDPVALPAERYWIEWLIVGPENDFVPANQTQVRDNECWVDYADYGGLQPGQAVFGVPGDLVWALGDAYIGIFADGVESNNTSAWTVTVP